MKMHRPITIDELHNLTKKGQIISSDIMS